MAARRPRRARRRAASLQPSLEADHGFKGKPGDHGILLKSARGYHAPQAGRALPTDCDAILRAAEGRREPGAFHAEVAFEFVPSVHSSRPPFTSSAPLKDKSQRATAASVLGSSSRGQLVAAEFVRHSSSRRSKSFVAHRATATAPLCMLTNCAGITVLRCKLHRMQTLFVPAVCTAGSPGTAAASDYSVWEAKCKRRGGALTAPHPLPPSRLRHRSAARRARPAARQSGPSQASAPPCAPHGTGAASSAASLQGSKGGQRRSGAAVRTHRLAWLMGGEMHLPVTMPLSSSFWSCSSVVGQAARRSARRWYSSRVTYPLLGSAPQHCSSVI